MPITIQKLLIFLFYNSHKLSYSQLTDTIDRIMQNVHRYTLIPCDIHVVEEDINTIQQYLLSLIFHARNTHYGGMNKPHVSYDLLFILYKYYPDEILNIIELYIYYGSFTDLNELIRLTYDRKEYFPITQTCYELYSKYLIIDYYKIKYFIEGGDHSVYISDCVLHIPKENKSLDKRTNATHEIVKCIYPHVYKHNKHSALKQFRKLYQPILQCIRQAETFQPSTPTLSEKSYISNNIQFTFLSIYNPNVLSFLFYTEHLPHMSVKHRYTRYVMDYYTDYINDYTWFSNNELYNHNIDIYSVKQFDYINVKHIFHYYETYLDYFWYTLTSTFDADCYKSVSEYLIE